MGPSETTLVVAAQHGDSEAFEQLVDLHRRSLRAHCYRMLGSLQDAEDALQETLLAAWRGLGGFEGRSSLRTWLHRIATNACLRLAGRRPQRVLSSDRGPAWTDVHDLGEFDTEDLAWLEPYPSEPEATDPVARYQQRENVELAFIAALQRLPATQRAVLILREVLELPAAEVAEALDTTVASVNSALQRARKTVDHRIVEGTQAGELQALGERGRRDLVAAFVAAWERADVDALLGMLAEDARFTMPPFPAWFQGRGDIGRFLAERTFQNPWRVRPLVVSGQLALACYRRDPDDGRFLLGALNVLTLRDGQIAEMNAFLDPATHRWFDLPEQVPDENFAAER
ncbi:MAG TPA: sigma-70 family RNA polymerase sigma factor [Acidimicrobiales bacterium]|nr:sigma-70 family RNA polymerase sigma factor [Acidimicrobiales bacterium]